MHAQAQRWDIFCRVVDNYGDVGVAWRLARCLAREHGRRVRLVLDDLTVLAHLQPQADAALAAQRVDGVDVSLWSEVFREGAAPEVADVVVETFGCDTPEAYVRAMAARRAHAALDQPRVPERGRRGSKAATRCLRRIRATRP